MIWKKKKKKDFDAMQIFVKGIVLDYLEEKLEPVLLHFNDKTVWVEKSFAEFNSRWDRWFGDEKERAEANKKFAMEHHAILESFAKGIHDSLVKLNGGK